MKLLTSLSIVLFALLAKAKAAEEFDYIVVGAGTSGAVLAGRLPSTGATVLVLEAGPENSVPNVFGASTYNVPRYEHDLPADEDLADSFYSEPMLGALGKRVKISVPKGPGGSSRFPSYYSRPAQTDFDGWNLPGWTSAELAEFFFRAESHANPGELNGNGGQLPIHANLPHSQADAFIQSAKNMLFPETDFSWGMNNFGVGNLSSLQDAGYVRKGSQDYLNIPNGGLLQVRYDARVTKVLFDKFSSPIVATGVEYIKGGVKRVVTCAKEVILSAGTIGTPRILEASGIGDANLLSQLRIPVVADLPAVGENLIMLPTFPILYALKDTVPLPEQNPTGFVDSPSMGQYLTGAGGFFAYHHAGAVLATTTSGSFGSPDIAITYSSVLPPYQTPYGTVSTGCTLINPASRGSTHIQSTEPSSDPKVQPNFYGNPLDIVASVTCLGLARTVAATPPFSDSVLTEVLPSPSFSSEETMAYYVLSQSTPAIESFGTAKMGDAADASAVVTPDLLVKGFANLRVADLSVVPSPVRIGGIGVGLMIGERAFSLISSNPYTVAIPPAHGLTVVSSFHNHALITEEFPGNNDACSMAGSRSLNLENDVNTCECQEAIAALHDLGASKAWIGPQKGTCRFLTSTGILGTEPCTNEYPVLCKK